MARSQINAISLCSGVGMLDEGVRDGFEYLGITLRTVAYAEWEAPAASQLIALMEAGCLEPAPVWCGDFQRLGAADFRGKVDCVIAGFPCQDLSVAGRRAGLDGERSGLFFRVLDIADDCGAQLIVLENVSGIASATASVVDPEEGELEERAAARVVGELADRGWHAEWLTVSASDVGGSHGRARWFCFAWRMAFTPSNRRHERRAESGGQQGRPDAAECGGSVANAGRPRREGREQPRTCTCDRGGRKHMDQLANFVEHSPSSPLARKTQGGPESSESAPTSPRRLNPAFGCWLMGWPCWWTNPGVTSSAKSEMVSYRSALQSHLSSFFGDPD